LEGNIDRRLSIAHVSAAEYQSLEPQVENSISLKYQGVGKTPTVRYVQIDNCCCISIFCSQCLKNSALNLLGMAVAYRFDCINRIGRFKELNLPADQ
jgi:hypothetical protein